MPIFDIVLEKQNGTEISFPYDTSRSLIDNAELDFGIFGELFVPKFYKVSDVVSRQNPGIKSKASRRIKISLGLACNRSCSYCNQAVERMGADTSRIADAKHFLKNLNSWWDGGSDGIGGDTKFEFWGGEPLLYWGKIKLLAETIRTYWPNVSFSMISNGDLLDVEKIEWLDKMGFSVGISHDGPGQHLRGGDPLDDPDRRAAIKLLMQTLEPKGLFSFNCVLTSQQYSLVKVEQWIAGKLGVKTVPLVTEGLMLPYDTSGMMLSPKADEHDLIYQTLFSELIEGSGYRNISIWNITRDFISGLKGRRPITSVGQKCGMDRSDNISVNLKGQVFTCQNTGTVDHLMGNVDDIENVKLTRATHHSLRKECRTCPVVHLCKGACMFLDGEKFQQACDNSFTYYSAILAGAFYHMSDGGILKTVSISDGSSIRNQLN